MSSSTPGNRLLIAGGGIAALEALLAVRELSEGEAQVTLLSPEREFIYRPLLVLEPFSPEAAERRDLPALLAEQGGKFVQDRLASVDPDRGAASTAAGVRLEFDFALIAIGARMRAAVAGAHTLWIERAPTPVETLLDRAEEAGALDLIVPPGVTWTLPIYEFALMAERRARERERAVPIRIASPEQSPLVIFGPAASAEVADLLAARGIEFTGGAWIHQAADGSLEGAGSHPNLDGYPVALPVLEAIPVPGLPGDRHGFLPVDEHARVRGYERIFAAGDGTDFPVKQGGIATQQADAAADLIAARIQGRADPDARRPVLRGRLLTGAESVHMSTPLVGGEGEGVVSDDYLWWPPHKVSGRWLAPWLAGGTLGADPEPPGRAIEVEVSAPHEWHSEVMPASKPGAPGSA